MNSIVKNISTVLLFTSMSFSLLASTIDDRLVGSWQGQRNQEGKCSFIAWKMVRTTGGKFEIVFYGDAEKKQVLGQEKGSWKASNNKFYIFTDNVSTPDIYTYKFTDDNSVKFSNIKRDSSADCMADYEFMDYRVS